MGRFVSVILWTGFSLGTAHLAQAIEMVQFCHTLPDAPAPWIAVRVDTTESEGVYRMRTLTKATEGNVITIADVKASATKTEQQHTYTSLPDESAVLKLTVELKNFVTIELHNMLHSSLVKHLGYSALKIKATGAELNGPLACNPPAQP